MFKIIDKIIGKIRGENLTDTEGKADFSETREAETTKIREVGSISSREVICPVCASEKVIRRGFRQKKLEKVQLYQCVACNKSFTPETIKGKRSPAKVVIDGLSYYNLGFSLEETCRLLKQKFGAQGIVAPSTLGGWITQYSQLCRFCRLRPYAIKMCRPKETVEVTTMAHRQLYRFRYHRPKLKLIISEHYKHRKFEPLMDYLDAVSSETPHQYFQDGLRMSEIKSKFDKAQMIIRGKKNHANELARFVLQSVKENKDRHEQLQRFMIANDSVTVATEVPVYIRKEDIEHVENVLGFQVVGEEGVEFKGKTGDKKIDLIALIDLISKKSPSSNDKKEAQKLSDKLGIKNLEISHLSDRLEQLEIRNSQKLPRLLTGHIDVLQVRNGQVHILDYKPNAAKEKPIEQLTWYALALSRLTGLRLYEFKCGWFDEKDYFEFFPLHVVYKLKSRKRKRVGFKSGIVVEVPEIVEGNKAMVV